jgi:hypothetical protein
MSRTISTHADIATSRESGASVEWAIANGVEIEKVASYAPDLIIGQYAGVTDKEYELL